MTIITRKPMLMALIGLALVLLLWHQVFVMTGVLWWNAPQPGQRLPAFTPVVLTPPDTHQIDLQAFLQTHPEWKPR